MFFLSRPKADIIWMTPYDVLERERAWAQIVTVMLDVFMGTSGITKSSMSLTRNERNKPRFHSKIETVRSVKIPRWSAVQYGCETIFNAGFLRMAPIHQPESSTITFYECSSKKEDSFLPWIVTHVNAIKARCIISDMILVDFGIITFGNVLSTGSYSSTLWFIRF